METDPQGETLYRELGARGVPVLLVDDQPIFGMNVRGWVDALTEPAVALTPPR